MSARFSKAALIEELSVCLAANGLIVGNLSAVFSIAFEAHNGQFRDSVSKSSKPVPYITHPVGVAKLAAEFFRDNHLQDSETDVVHAALLHDVLEDTAVEIGGLTGLVTDRCLELVLALTKPAVSGRTSRTQRNQEFLQKIREAGKTAAFLKIADSLHNLSRPNLMPTSLLKKTIEKSRRDYAPFLVQFKLGNNLISSYNDAVDRAIDLQKTVSPKKEAEITAQGFLQICVSKVHGKVLEPHDIVDIVLLIPGVSVTYDGDIDGFMALDFISNKNFSHQQVKKISRSLADGLYVDIPNRSIGGEEDENVSRVYPLRIDDLVVEKTNRSILLVQLDRRLTPSWATWEFLQSSIGLLAERHRNRQIRQMSDTAELISRSQINLSPALAVRASLSSKEISRLQELLRGAELTKELLQFELLDTLNSMGIVDAGELVEARVKSPDSIIAKKFHRGFDNVQSVDDVLGLRVVLPSRKHVNDFEKVLTKRLTNSGVRLLGRVEEPKRVEVSTSAGYRGTHLYFSIEFSRDLDLSLNCEIQLRTVMEDAWAKISHLSSYKKNSKQGKKSLNVLKSLSSSMAELDSEIGKIFN